MRPSTAFRTSERYAALPPARHDLRYFSRAGSIRDRKQPYRPLSILCGVLLYRGHGGAERFADVLPRLFLHDLVVRRGCDDYRRTQRAIRMGGKDLAALFLPVLDVLGFLLSRGLAAAWTAQRSALPALSTGIRDHPRRDLRYDGQDLRRPLVYGVRAGDFVGTGFMAVARSS